MSFSIIDPLAGFYKEGKIMGKDRSKIFGKYCLAFTVILALGNTGALFAQDKESQIIITGVRDEIDTYSDLCIFKGDSIDEIRAMFLEETIADSILAGNSVNVADNEVSCTLKPIADGEIMESALWAGGGEYYVVVGYMPYIYISRTKVNITEGNIIVPFSEFISLGLEEQDIF
jgi:hypothetical protein